MRKGHKRMKCKSKQTGVTLFEMLLLLFLLSLAVVAGIRYANQQQEESVAEKLAIKMFEYSAGVKEWLNQHENDIRAASCTDTGSSDPCYFEGVEWLQSAGVNERGEAYLSPDFSFGTGLAPLALMNQSGQSGDDIIETRFFLAQPANPNSEIKVTIALGALYDLTPGVDSKGNTLPPEILPEVTADAAKLASDMVDPLRGVSPFVFDVDFDPGPTQFEILGTMQDVSKTTEKYLRIDGENYMTDNLDFQDQDIHGGSTDPEGHGIRYIENIQFDDDVVTKVTNIDEFGFDAAAADSKIENLVLLDFDGVSEMNDVRTINFQTVGGAKINNLKTLTFHSSGANLNLSGSTVSQLNKITFTGNDSLIDALTRVNPLPSSTQLTIDDLKYVQFKNGGRINSMRFYTCSISTSPNYMVTLLARKSGTDGGVCFLIKDTDESNCRVVYGKNDIYRYYVGAWFDGTPKKCAFGCLVWDDSVYSSSAFCKEAVPSSTPGYSSPGWKRQGSEYDDVLIKSTPGDF